MPWNATARNRTARAGRPAPLAGQCARWGTALAVAVSVVVPPAVAQMQGAAMPLPPGVVREKGLETAAGGEDAAGRWMQVYRVGAPIEMVFTWYLQRMNPSEDAPQDTSDLRPGEVTPVGYHLTYHTFTDECRDADADADADAAAGASAPAEGAPPCTRWRRGKDKLRALNNSRMPLRAGAWLERFTLTWFTRGDKGDLVRRQIEVRDTGLNDSWQHDNLRSRITLERSVVAQ